MERAQSLALEAQEEGPMPRKCSLQAQAKASLTSVIPSDQAICQERKRKHRGRDRKAGRRKETGRTVATGDGWEGKGRRGEHRRTPEI